MERTSGVGLKSIAARVRNSPSTNPALALFVVTVLAGVGLGAALAAFTPSPATPASVTVAVWPLDTQLLRSAALPEVRIAPAPGVETVAGDLGLRTFTARGSTAKVALDQALKAAREYTARLVRGQDHLISRGEATATAPQRAARRALRAAPLRYAISYDRATARRITEGSPARGATLGLLSALCVAAIGRLAAGRWSHRRVGPLILAASLGVTAVVVVAASAGPAWLTVALAIGLLFAASFAFTLIHLRAGIFALLVLLVLVTPLRGALLALAGSIHLPHALLFVNAIPPALVAGSACAALLQVRQLVNELPRPLLAAWGAVVFVAIANIVTQTVGISVYALGFGQYLVYPTLAVLAWLAVETSGRPFVALLFAAAAMVALSIAAEAANLVNFVEAVPPVDPVTGTPRWGGATGSYIHASLFLGTAVPLLVATLRGARLRMAAVGCVLALVLIGLALTYSRGGVVVALVGLVVLMVVARGRDRRRVMATCLVAVAAIAGAALVVGAGPKLAARATSVFDWRDDRANVQRLDAMKAAIERFDRAPLQQKVLGEGLAATGNTQKLADRAPVATENLFLKFLVEVGLVGMAVIGAVVIWAAFTFTQLAWRAAGRPELQADGAAGLALTFYGLAYPILEPQLIAFVWWLLLAIALRTLVAVSPQPRAHEAQVNGPLRRRMPRASQTSLSQRLSVRR